MNRSRLSISYLRKNITFVRRLALNLEQAGRNPWGIWLTCAAARCGRLRSRGRCAPTMRSLPC